jgi:hypothetical protein
MLLDFRLRDLLLTRGVKHVVVVLCDQSSVIAHIARLVLIEACAHTFAVVHGVRETMAYSSVESSSVAHGAGWLLNELYVQSCARALVAIRISLTQLEVVYLPERLSGEQVLSADVLEESASIPMNADRVETLRIPCP